MAPAANFLFVAESSNDPAGAPSTMTSDHSGNSDGMENARQKWLLILCLCHKQSLCRISYCPFSNRDTARKRIFLFCFGHFCHKSHGENAKSCMSTKMAAAEPPPPRGARPTAARHLRPLCEHLSITVRNRGGDSASTPRRARARTLRILVGYV